MDSTEYSYADLGTNALDKTTGGVSKLAGITFGTDEESFHSDEFDRELGKALAVGAARRHQSKKTKDRFLEPVILPTDQTLSPDSSTEPNRSRQNGEDEVDQVNDHSHTRAQRNPKSAPQSSSRSPSNPRSNNNQSKTPSRVTTRHPRGVHPNEKPFSGAPRSMPSKRNPSNLGITRVYSGPSSPGSGQVTFHEDSNMNSIHRTLNDSAAFALSPPVSPEVSRRNSSNGAGPHAVTTNIAGKKPTNAGVPKRSLGGESTRGKGAHLTLREQEKVIDEVKKENFNLKLKIYFLEDRLAKLAPDQVDLALKENVEIKVEFQTVRQELKRYKRLLLEAERAIAQAKAERDEVILQQTLDSQLGSPRLQDQTTISRLELELRETKERLAATISSNQERTSELERQLQRAKASRSSTTEITSMLAHSKQDSNAQRHPMRTQNNEDWVKEEHLLEIKNLRSELTEERQAKEDLLADHQELQYQLSGAQSALRESRYVSSRNSRADERGMRSEAPSRAHSRLDSHDEYGRKTATTPASTAASAHRIKDLKREVDDVYSQLAMLEDENASLRSQITAQVTMLTTRNSEKEKLQDQVHALKRQLIELEDELQRGDSEFEKIQSHNNGQMESDELRDELNLYRDKLASALLNLEKREKEIDELNQELQERETMFAQQLDKANEDCGADIDATKADMDHLQDLIEEREDQLHEVTEQLRAIVQLQENTDKTLREKSSKLEQKSHDYEAAVNELEATQADLKEIGAGNRELAAEVEEKEQQILSLNSELDELEREMSNNTTVHEQVVSKLKQKLNNTKMDLNELTIQHETAMSEAKFLREKHEELALRQAEMEERRRSEADVRRRLERDLDDMEREVRDAREENSIQIVQMKKEKRDLQASFQQQLDAKQKALSQAESELAHAKGRLEAREEDLAKLQSALKSVETESFRLNESQSHDRFSLELEIERLHRDLANAGKDVSEAKLEADKAQNETRSLNSKVMALQQENDEISDQLEQVKQSRKQLNERFEEQAKTIRQAQNELASAKDRIQSLEDDMSQDHKLLSKTEAQYREQLSERNTLLLTIYQYVDKLVNSGGALKKGGNTDAKPFSNFSVFHDSVINRLKSLSVIQSGFDTKIKEFESRLEKQYTALKRQHDSRMRQLDQFETTIKLATDTQRQWRARLTTKQGEVESARETASELQKQISSLKQRASIAGTTPGTITEHTKAVNRASHLEKRLVATQTQLKTAEEKLNEAKVKVAAAEGSWQARLRELQERNRELEEKVKRERQGAKERMNELMVQVTNLKEQVEASDRRGKQLDSVIKTQQATKGNPSV